MCVMGTICWLRAAIVGAKAPTNLTTDHFVAAIATARGRSIHKGLKTMTNAPKDVGAAPTEGK